VILTGNNLKALQKYDLVHVDDESEDQAAEQQYGEVFIDLTEYGYLTIEIDFLEGFKAGDVVPINHWRYAVKAKGVIPSKISKLADKIGVDEYLLISAIKEAIS
jgi:hypothetical protein